MVPVTGRSGVDPGGSPSRLSRGGTEDDEGKDDGVPSVSWRRLAEDPCSGPYGVKGINERAYMCICVWVCGVVWCGTLTDPFPMY